MERRPDDLTVLERYKVLIGSITPRPIAFVSTISPDGSPNLAPFSFYSAVGSDPMMVLFCPANTPSGGEKDSLRNAKPVSEGGQGEFVINLATESYAQEMAKAAEPLPYEESEFDLSGLAAAACSVVRPPRVLASPVSLECQTTQVVRTNPGAAGGGNVVFGNVVNIWIDDAAVDDRMRIDPAVLKTIGRMGGASYCTTRDRFEMEMGIRKARRHGGTK